MAHFIRRGQANFNSRFHTAVHELHAPPVASYRTSPMALASAAAARAADAERALRAIPLATAEAYDRSAIMRIALWEARGARARGSKTPWRKLISTELRAAWLRAKLARSLLIAQAPAH